MSAIMLYLLRSIRNSKTSLEEKDIVNLKLKISQLIYRANIGFAGYDPKDYVLSVYNTDLLNVQNSTKPWF